MRKKFTPPYRLKAFTLSEVLITIVIIGVVAAITIPAVLDSLQNQEYKVGYKKAFSDLSQAAAEGVAFGEFPYRENKYDNDTTIEEWNILKNRFGVLKVCENYNPFDCWVDADRIFDEPKTHLTYSFVDLSGRAWIIYYRFENIYMVDTNGDKSPNKFGKDRWVFTFADDNGSRICGGNPCRNPGTPKCVIPYINTDIKTSSTICHYPPCNYKSWLIN